MAGKLTGKVAIVTGGAAGIGRAVVDLFADEGCQLVVSDVADKEGEASVERAAARGAEALFVRCDVTRSEDVRRLVSTTLDRFGQLDVLFNNAGIVSPEFPVGSVTEAGEEAWDRVIDVNLKSIYLVSKYAIPQMVKQRSGSVINTASSWGLMASDNSAAYVASKAGVVNLTRSMALDYGRYNVRVNCVCPGPTETAMLVRTLARDTPEQSERFRADYLRMLPLRRWARPEEIARGVLFLASDDASYVTGSALVIDGGYTAGREHAPD
jgi:NAD(P)-dependent dehydrogenase (short-subunit alcohol dehydrogenase family)